MNFLFAALRTFDISCATALEVKKQSKEKRMALVSAVVLVVSSLSSASAELITPSLAAPTIQQVSVKAGMVGGKWVETVTLRNNGANAANGLIVTSCAYNDKSLTDPENDKGPRKDSATPAEPGAQFAQQKAVNIPAGGIAVVTFTYEGVDAKPWKSYYIDVYNGAINIRNRVVGTAAFYSFLPVAPGQGGTFAVDFDRPFPAALIGSGISGSSLFSVEITSVNLPLGWSLTDFGPLAYILAADGSAPFSTLMQANFTSAGEIYPGDIAFLDYDAVLDGTDQRWSGVMGIEVVPEPSFWLITAVLLGAIWRLRPHRNHCP